MTPALLLSLLAEIVAGPDLAKFDLAKVAPRAPTCKDATSSDDILVCAKKGMDLYVANLDGYAEKPIRAKTTGPLNSTVELQAVTHGTPTAKAPAAMVTLKWRF